MMLMVKILLTLLAGLALGLGATFIGVSSGNGLGRIDIGPWIAWPKAGTSDADPYARAALARSGAIPLGVGEGVAFIAESDSAGAPLDPRCVYRISGSVPTARLWTIAVSSPGGMLIEVPSHRYGFTSAELVRDGAGAFAILVSASPRPGNWLQIDPTRRFVLALRLYDTSLDLSAPLDPRALPLLARGECG
jgi:hypothetical protein